MSIFGSHYKAVSIILSSLCMEIIQFGNYLRINISLFTKQSYR